MPWVIPTRKVDIMAYLHSGRLSGSANYVVGESDDDMKQRPAQGYRQIPFYCLWHRLQQALRERRTC